MDPDRVWERITDASPVGFMLKDVLRDRSVRFYGLPGGKRHPGSEEEYAEIQQRVDALVRDACGGLGSVLVVTGRNAPALPIPLITDGEAQVHHQPSYRREIRDEVALGDDDWPLHLWTSWHPFVTGTFNVLVRYFADEELDNVLIVAPEPGVVLHPYDGGIDVILPTPKERDEWRVRYAEWASTHPLGL